MFKSKYVVVLMGSSESSALGPFDSKGEAIERAADIIVGLGIDRPYMDGPADARHHREGIIEGLRHNTRNDVCIAKLAPGHTKVGLGAA